MDAVGCFEGDEEEEEDDEEEEEIEVEEEFHKQVLGERGCGKEAGGWTPTAQPDLDCILKSFLSLWYLLSSNCLILLFAMK